MDPLLTTRVKKAGYGVEDKNNQYMLSLVYGHSNGILGMSIVAIYY